MWPYFDFFIISKISLESTGLISTELYVGFVRNCLYPPGSKVCRVEIFVFKSDAMLEKYLLNSVATSIGVLKTSPLSFCSSSSSSSSSSFFFNYLTLILHRTPQQLYVNILYS